MRLIADKALKGANAVIGRLMENMQAGNVLSDDEKRMRYAALHQGNPLSTLVFASRAYQQNPQPGTNPLMEAVKYEREMEKLNAGGESNG